MNTATSPHKSANQTEPGQLFSKAAHGCVRTAGHPLAFGLAVSVILLWALTGPLFGFSDTWQLVINTATTIITFLMVFLIQNAQNRDSEAIQLKLDELIRATEAARNAFLNLEDISELDLDQIKANFSHIARQAREDIRRDKGGPKNLTEVTPPYRRKNNGNQQTRKSRGSI